MTDTHASDARLRYFLTRIHILLLLSFDRYLNRRLLHPCSGREYSTRIAANRCVPVSSIIYTVSESEEGLHISVLHSV